MSRRDPAVSLRQLTSRRGDPIPWPQIVGLRNRLIHGYDNIDYDIVWEIVTTDLPLLVLDLSRSDPD